MPSAVLVRVPFVTPPVDGTSTNTDPPLSCVPPLMVLAPVSVKVALPALVMPVVPASVDETVALALVVMVPPAVKVRVLPVTI